MMRFVDLGHQLGLDDEWPRQFAFYNTVPDQFLDFGGSQVWDSWDDLEKDMRMEKSPQDFIDRLKGLCAVWVFKK